MIMKIIKNYYNVIFLYEKNIIKAIKRVVIKSKMKGKKERPIKVD